jgi:hypothetical protein
VVVEHLEVIMTVNRQDRKEQQSASGAG